jgi:hypothetical protein
MPDSRTVRERGKILLELNYHVYPDGRMKPKDAAIYTGFSEGTLANWRVTGKGPAFVKKGSRIFYYKQVLDDWLAGGGSCSSTAQARLTSVN